LTRKKLEIIDIQRYLLFTATPFFKTLPSAINGLMESSQDCIEKLRDEIAFYEAKIQELQKLPKEQFPKLLIPIIRV